jgi:competence protein ComFC
MGQKLEGVWDGGLAVDLHTISSIPCGQNEFGHTIFDTKRTPLGELVHQCKYKGDKHLATAIAEQITSRVGNINEFDFLLPAPPSNLVRPFQPVLLIIAELSKATGVPVLHDVFAVKPHTQLKSVSTNEERLQVLRQSLSLAQSPNIAGKKILLFDDLYRSGSTLTVLCELLRPLAPAKICVLTATKTRSRR